MASVAVKVWGVMLVVGALGAAPSTIVFVTLAPAVSADTAVFRASQVGQILNLVLQAGLGIALVLLADRIVAWLIPDRPPLFIEVCASELAALAFALVGVYVLVQGAENIAATVYTLATRPSWPRSSDSAFWYVWERQRETIVSAFVQIAAGAALMFGRRPIVNAWWWLRGGVGSTSPS